MYNLRDFHLSDMVRLDGALRAAGRDTPSMEAAARTIVGLLADQLVDKETGDRSCILARLFVTVPLGRLEAPLQAAARSTLPPELRSSSNTEGIRCLTLLATVGDETGWCSRHLSEGHAVIPLPTEAAVHRSPMIGELLRQLGIDAGAMAAGAGTELFVGQPGGSLDVFHVEEAVGSPHVPAQDGFVLPYNVRSVLGFGGVLPDGELYAVICFSRTPIPRETAEKFATVASSVGLVLLSHVGGRVFDSDSGRRPAVDGAREAWRAEALEQLLKVHEASVLDQSLRLEEALSTVEDRAVELDRSRRATGRTEALKSAMLASAADAIVSIDADGSIIEWNPAAERIFGTRRDVALGQPIAELLVPERHRAAHWAGLARYLTTGAQVILGKRIEIEAQHADGHEIPVEITVSRAEAPGPPVFTAFLRDTTEARRADEQRRALQVSERAATARLGLLAEAGRTLGTSLEYATTLQQITELSLTVLGELCVIHLRDPETGRLAQVAWAHRDPERGRIFDQLRDFQPPAGSPLDAAMSRGQTIALPTLSEAEMRAATNTEREFELGRALTLGPTMVVPLIAHGATIGTLTVGRSRAEDAYDPDTTALAEALAERAAAAIDNSRAHAARTEVALTLQRSLMPMDLVTPGGLAMGFCYQPGTVGTEVGGDWFDVIPLTVGRCAVVIGDVMGRGIRAAAVMGQLRAAVRAYASLDLAPDILMTELDRLVQGLGDGALVTAVYGVLDTLTGELALCSAGHPPPVAMTSSEARALDLPTGAPLGVGGVRFETAVLDLSEDTALLLYTDGLVESRQRDAHVGVEQLIDLVADLPAAAANDLDALCERLLQTMVGPAGHDDDAAVLAVRRSVGSDKDRARRVLLGGGVGGISRARSALSAALRGWGVPAIADTCVLLAGELLANAVRHAGTDIEMRFGLFGGVVSVEIHDQGEGTPDLRQPDLDEESGRGMLLVDALSERWGVRRSPGGGKSVWFELQARPEV